LTGLWDVGTWGGKEAINRCELSRVDILVTLEVNWQFYTYYL